MSDVFRITLAQLNPTVGDLVGNAAKAREVWQAGKDAGSDLVALPAAPPSQSLHPCLPAKPHELWQRYPPNPRLSGSIAPVLCEKHHS